MIRILVNGAAGRMGQETCRAIGDAPDLFLVGKTGRGDNLAARIKASGAEVVVDFTTADAGYQNAGTIIEAGARPVIGTSGFLPEHVAHLKKLCAEKKRGGIIAPNFSLGAVLMMRYARDAAHHFSSVEIIEMHHAGKADAPSGTAIKTAQMIAEARRAAPLPLKEKELLPGARGARCNDIPIHSVRLPGLFAHQTVVFGGQGETLAIRHDSIHAISFMPGVLLACRQVMGLQELVYGLENLLGVPDPVDEV